MKILRTIFSFTFKIIALFIPILASVLILYNQYEVKQCISECEQTVVENLANAKDINTKQKYEIIESINNLIDNDYKASNDYLISLFGIIISVWVGLNIYNVLKKDDFLDLSNTIDEKCKDHDKLQKEIENEQEKVNDIHERNMELHISYLLKTFDVNNNSSEYFYSMFKDMDAKKIDYRFLLNATFLETIYVKLTTLHNNSEHSKMEYLIKEGFERCDKMLKSIDSFTKNKSLKEKLLGYVTYRHGKMYFYQGMYIYYHEKLKFREAILNFEQAANKISHAIEYDEDIKKGMDVYNTLGYIYIKMFTWEQNCANEIFHKERLEKYLELAFEKCSKSKLKTALSIKNYGIVHEHKNDLEQAIELYTKSITLDPYDYNSRICLASAYLKRVMKLMKIDERTKPLCKRAFTLTEDIRNNIDSAKFQLELAYTINSHAVNYYYKMGQLYTYEFLLDRDNQEYKNIAVKNFEISNGLKPIINAHSFHERNYYEAVGDIKKAHDINKSLNGDDVERLGKMYEEYLNEQH